MTALNVLVVETDKILKRMEQLRLALAGLTTLRKAIKEGRLKGVCWTLWINPKRKSRFWGLDDYLRKTQKEGFKGKVTPQFWAVPYLSIMYPSTQVQVSQKGDY